jgi:hypothetical protein
LTTVHKKMKKQITMRRTWQYPVEDVWESRLASS